jgi:hypothetical protein
MTDPRNFVSPKGVTITDVELYGQHVIHYFDTQMNHDILNLSDADKAKMFQMFTDYADVLVQIFHKGIPILEYIAYGDQWKSAKENNHPGIRWDYDCPIVAEYKAWVEAKKS